ncbi:uncharacterized protein RBU33_005679 isoform 1-T1 [Hipposideros larvatus]
MVQRPSAVVGRVPLLVLPGLKMLDAGCSFGLEGCVHTLSVTQLQGPELHELNVSVHSRGQQFRLLYQETPTSLDKL